MRQAPERCRAAFDFELDERRTPSPHVLVGEALEVPVGLLKLSQFTRAWRSGPDRGSERARRVTDGQRRPRPLSTEMPFRKGARERAAKDGES